MKVDRIITGVILAFVVIMFLLQMVPELETEIGATTITNTFVLAMLDMMIWILPVAAIVAVIVLLFRLVKSRSGG